MRLPPGNVFVMTAVVGVLGSWPTASTVQQGGPCAAEAQAVETARAAFQAATKAVFALEDKIAIQEELIRAQEAVLNLSTAAERQAYNQWQTAVDRFNACAAKPRNNVCEAERKAMEAATDALNAKLKVRRKDEAELKASRDALADLQKACDEARDVWYDALKALQKAQAAMSGCRRFQ
jgi:hypothetical protein